ncbi:alpha/beta fold hydrolase [Nocardia sp. NPDC051570]|uniref:alpha/beta fold hydrolase n=1 Tax=Nocardia sp. NPDC051570 TaxID=3364324 RepID=UPI00378EDE5C
MTTTPLVLLHGLGMSALAWDDVVPALSRHHVVFAATMLGHRGGPRVTRHPAGIDALATDIERRMDERGWETAHFAGNSLGGWVALELARRGRARSVCALTPAGFWTAGGHGHTVAAPIIRRMAVLTRLTRPVAPIGLRSATIRRFALRDVAERGERVGPRRILAITDDLLACDILDDYLPGTEQIAPLDPLPCPVTLAWAERDHLLPVSINATIARERVPQARFEILTGAGHVPMLDSPRRVVRAILDTTARAELSPR